MSGAVIAVFILFAFFLLEYATFFWFKRRWGLLSAIVAAHVVALVFGGALYPALRAIGVVDLVTSHAAYAAP